MEIKVSTEETDLEELKQALDIIKRAINKRDNAGQTELPKEILAPVQEEEIKEPEKYEEPEVKQPERMIEEPKPIPVKIEQPRRIPPPPVDMSALTMSDRGKRSMSSSNSSMRPSQSFSQPSFQQPKTNEKDSVMEIINNLKRKNPDGPLYMQNIVSLAGSKGISEERTRRLVSELKDSNSI